MTRTIFEWRKTNILDKEIKTDRIEDYLWQNSSGLGSMEKCKKDPADECLKPYHGEMFPPSSVSANSLISSRLSTPWKT